MRTGWTWGRVGIMPQAKYLCTPAAKERQMIEWAYRNSMSRPG